MSLKKKVKSRRVTYGSWITVAHPALAELMARAGFDWLVIDLEHSTITLPEAQTLIQVIELNGVVPLVRVTRNDPDLIKRVMDAGARGIIVPMVNSPDEARAAVRAVRYPPEGNRGVGLARAQGYGFEFQHYMSRVSRETLVIVQIEHVKAVDCAEEIFRVPGLDGFIVGPYDLSGSLGIPGRFEHPRMRGALRRIHTIAQKMKIPAGFHVVPPSASQVRRRVREGYTFIALSLDTVYLGTACRTLLKEVRRG